MTESANASHITVFDSALSKVRYLETILDGRDWRTQIIFPKEDAHAFSALQDTKKALTSGGYKLDETRNAHGDLVLHIHHYGSGTEIRDLIRHKGLTRGIGYSIAHPNIPLEELMKTSRGILNEMGNFFKNPASANGLIFVAAEIFLTAAGMGNKAASGKKETFLQRMKQPKNYMQSLAGALFLSQSLVYMLFAKDNEQQAMERLHKKTDALEKNPDKLEISFDPEKDAPKNNLAGRFSRFLKNHPVEIGAVANDLGMLAYMAHAVYSRRDFRKAKLGFEGKDNFKQLSHLSKEIAAARKGNSLFKSKATRNASKAALENLKTNQLFADADAYLAASDYVKRGFVRDIGGALTSILAWSLLLIPSKKKTEEEKHADKEAAQQKGFFGKLIQKFKDDPETGTGILALGSSGQRLLGSLSKRNYLQTIGESIYVPGDVLLMFTKNSEFGSSGRADIEKLSKHIAEDINNQSMLLGPSAQRSLARDAAVFLRDRALAEMEFSKKTTQAPLTPKELAAQTIKLEQAVLRRVAYTQSERFDEMLDSAATLIHRLPAPMRNSARAHISQTFSQLPWLHATKQEIDTGLMRAARPLVEDTPPVSNVKKLSGEVKALVHRAPRSRQSEFAVVITEALSQLAQHTPDVRPKPHIQDAIPVDRLSKAPTPQAAQG